MWTLFAIVVFGVVAISMALSMAGVI